MNTIQTLEKKWLESLSRNWWVLFGRGVAGVLFSILLWTLPANESVETLIFAFAVYALIDGLLQMWTAFFERKERDNWLIHFLWGAGSVLVGFLVFFAPSLTTMALLFYMGLWSIAKGILEIIAAVRLRKELLGEWFLILSGIISFSFGCFLLLNPEAVAAVIIWVIAMYAFIIGLFFIALSVKLKKVKSINAVED